MPWPVECLLKRPLMTLTFFFNGSSGDRLRPSVISSPEPVAPQWFSLTPLPMNRTANRFGKGELDGVAANADSESSHGSAMVTPAPRRTVRRDNFISLPLSGCGAFLQELRARDDGFDQSAESIAARRELVIHPLNQRLVRKLQRSAQ